MTDFFEDVKGKLYKTTITTVQNKLKRIKDYTTTVLPKELVAAMQELVRPRETLVRYSDLGTLYVDKKPAELADQLFEQLVHHSLITEEYQEQLMVRAIRAQLKTEKLTHFKKQALAGRYDEITFRWSKNQRHLCDPPSGIPASNAGKILDRAQTWLDTLTILAQNDVLKKDKHTAAATETNTNQH